MPGRTRTELPATLQWSPAKAQRTYRKAHDSAVEQHGEGEVAHRVALAAVKHSFEKVGDRWEPKQRRGPSDPRAASPEARHNQGATFGGVDCFGHTREERYRRAHDLGVRGASRMSKQELAAAIATKQ